MTGPSSLPTGPDVAEPQVMLKALLAFLRKHERQIDWPYEESECSCGRWNDHKLNHKSFESHLAAAARAAFRSVSR